jgi:hypothetical protein
MRKTIIAVAALAACTAIAAPGASARDSFLTGVTIQGETNTSAGYLVHGFITSDKSKCRGDRKLQMLIDPGGGYEVRDSGRSSKNGAWALLADSSDATAIKVKALVKKLPNGDTCKAASNDVSF